MKKWLRLYLRHLRFNRYMVECESSRKSNNVGESTCFNRYMVECELNKYFL